jgi:hypothetical protein
MATYGYSAGYQGGGPQAVPSGYIEAYSQAGRNIGQGIQQIGNAIGESLQRYGQNKAENEFLTSRLESLAPYLNTVAQSGNIMDKNTPESKLLGDIEKFSSMSIPQKKATLLNAEFYLDRADKAKARELQDLQTQQIKNQITTQQQLGELMRYGMTMPTTQTVTEPTTEMLQPVGPVQPATMPPTAPVFDQQGYMQALERYRQQSSVAPSDTQAIQAQLAKLQPMLVERPQQFRIPSLQGGIGGGMGVSMATITENPKQAVGRILDAQRQQQVLQAQLQRAQAPQPTMPTREQFTTQPAAQQPAAQFLPPIEVQGQTTRTEAVPYENLRRNIAQYAAQQGMRPEVFAGLDRVLEIAGQQKPIQIDTQTLPGGITVVRADGKVDILPAPKMVEGKPLTEAQGKSAAFAAGMKLNNETINSVFKSGYSPRSLTEFGFMPERLKTDSRKSYEAARDAWIENFLRDRSGAVISPDEYPAAEKQYFPIAGDSEKVVKQKELMRIDAMNNTMKKAGQNADDYVNQISSGGQTRSPLLSDPRVAAIRARQASGAITKQQAVQQIESLK